MRPQRALMQYFRPENHALVLEALRRAGREDLIGFGKECLIPPRPIRPRQKGEKAGKGEKPNAKGKPFKEERQDKQALKTAAKTGKPPRKDGEGRKKSPPERARGARAKSKRPAKPSPTGKRRG